MKFPGPIYVIFMPQREEYIKGVFKNMGITAQFIPAVSGIDLPPLQKLIDEGILGHDYLKNYNIPGDAYIAYEADPKNTKIINSNIKGVLALQLSYLQIFDMFLSNSSNDHCFIFEDDILYQNPAKTMHRLNEIFAELPPDFDVVNFGRCFDKCKQNIIYSKNLVTNTRPLCMHSCGYSKKIIKYILANTLPMQVACDTFLRELFSTFAGFSVSPALFFQNKKLGTFLGNVPWNPECSDIKIKKKKMIKKDRKRS